MFTVILDPQFSIESPEVKRFFRFINLIVKRKKVLGRPITEAKKLTVVPIDVEVLRKPYDPKSILEDLKCLHRRSLNRDEMLQFAMKKSYDPHHQRRMNIIIGRRGDTISVVGLCRGEGGFHVEPISDIPSNAVILARRIRL